MINVSLFFYRFSASHFVADVKAINAKVDYKNHCVNCLICIKVEVYDFVCFSAAFLFA